MNQNKFIFRFMYSDSKTLEWDLGSELNSTKKQQAAINSNYSALWSFVLLLHHLQKHSRHKVITTSPQYWLPPSPMGPESSFSTSILSFLLPFWLKKHPLRDFGCVRKKSEDKCCSTFSSEVITYCTEWGQLLTMAGKRRKKKDERAAF